jgi:hypothetical protein
MCIQYTRHENSQLIDGQCKSNNHDHNTTLVVWLVNINELVDKPVIYSSTFVQSDKNVDTKLSVYDVFLE